MSEQLRSSGHADSNGKMIMEGDIVVYKDDDDIEEFYDVTYLPDDDVWLLVSYEGYEYNVELGVIFPLTIVESTPPLAKNTGGKESE